MNLIQKTRQMAKEALKADAERRRKEEPKKPRRIQATLPAVGSKNS